MTESEIIRDALDGREADIIASCEAHWADDDLFLVDDDAPDLSALFTATRKALGRPQPVDAGLDAALAEIAVTIATGNQSLGVLTRQILHLQDAIADVLVTSLQPALHREALMRLSISVGHLIGAIGTARLQNANLEASRSRMTGLLAKDAFYSDIERACSAVLGSAGGDEFIVASIDLDDLKTINDTLGHDAGDKAIRALAQALSGAVGSRGTPYHLSGDEFGLIIHGCGDVLPEIRDIAVANGAPGFSIGWVVVDIKLAEREPEDVYHEADIRMYDEKRAKKAARE
jgi:diguanylate cyclase (GGDEF)-like protein